MRRGEFLAYLEAQAAGYAGTFDEWEFDQYPRLQPPGFGASDLDEVCQVDKLRLNFVLVHQQFKACSMPECVIMSGR